MTSVSVVYISRTGHLKTATSKDKSEITAAHAAIV